MRLTCRKSMVHGTCFVRYVPISSTHFFLYKCYIYIYIYIYMYIDTHIHMGKDWMDPVYRSTRFIEMLTPDKYLILDPVYRSTRSIEMLTPDKYLIYVNISIGLEFPMHWNQTCSLSLSHLIYHSYLFVYFIPCGLACTLLKTRFIEDK